MSLNKILLNISVKNILILSLLLIVGSNVFGQDELNQPNLRFYLSDDKTSYAGAVFVNQIWNYTADLTSVFPKPPTWLAQMVNLPLDMAPGKYRLALWLPDAASKLHSRPEYSIRFANHNVWNATKGYNVLSESVIINP